ncbi:hypothetical protein D3C87_766650 [compost metagenome]
MLYRLFATMRHDTRHFEAGAKVEILDVPPSRSRVMVRGRHRDHTRRVEVWVGPEALDAPVRQFWHDGVLVTEPFLLVPGYISPACDPEFTDKAWYTPQEVR